MSTGDLDAARVPRDFNLVPRFPQQGAERRVVPTRDCAERELAAPALQKNPKTAVIAKWTLGISTAIATSTVIALAKFVGLAALCATPVGWGVAVGLAIIGITVAIAVFSAAKASQHGTEGIVKDVLKPVAIGIALPIITALALLFAFFTEGKSLEIFGHIGRAFAGAGHVIGHAAAGVAHGIGHVASQAGHVVGQAGRAAVDIFSRGNYYAIDGNPFHSGNVFVDLIDVPGFDTTRGEERATNDLVAEVNEARRTLQKTNVFDPISHEEAIELARELHETGKKEQAEKLLNLNFFVVKLRGSEMGNDKEDPNLKSCWDLCAQMETLRNQWHPRLGGEA